MLNLSIQKPWSKYCLNVQPILIDQQGSHRILTISNRTKSQPFGSLIYFNYSPIPVKIMATNSRSSGHEYHPVTH